MAKPKFNDIEAHVLYEELLDSGMDEIAAEEFVRCIEEEVKDVK